jgi:hypothetical protein
MTTDEPRGRRTDEERQMRHVDHTPPDGDGARAVWERGGEARPDDDEEDAAEEDRERVGVADE